MFFEYLHALGITLQSKREKKYILVYMLVIFNFLKTFMDYSIFIADIKELNKN